LDTFTTQKIGTPNVCDHTFCVACLKKWSKNENICPIDRREFYFIFVRHQVSGKITKIIPVTVGPGLKDYISWNYLDIYLIIFFIAFAIIALIHRLVSKLFY
jgi:putative Ca2+/H+ antiporter (TMEM165/GDT1 family)